MRPQRPLLFIPAAIAILAVAALLLLWLGARTPYARRVAGGWIEEATGLPASIERLRLGFLRGPALEVHGFALGQPEGFGAGRILEIGKARIEIPWGSLFGGSAVDAIAISDAVARPALAAGGGDNWTALIDRLAELGGEGEGAWSVGALGLERGAVEFQDASTGTAWRLTAISLAARQIAPGADFPVDLRLAGVAGPNTFHLALNGTAQLDPDAGRYAASGLGYTGWAGGDPLPLAGVELAGRLQSATWIVEARSAAFRGGSFNLAGVPGTFEGELALGEDSMRMNLLVRTDSFAPRAPAVAFGRPLPATADPQAFGALQATFTCSLEDGVLRLDPIQAQLDDTTIEGRLVPRERFVRLSADRIEFDRYLAPEKETRKDKKATLESAVAALRELDLDAEIRIEEAKVAGAKLRDTVLRIERLPVAP
ncbi:MAG TPA: hypothetical protein VFR29_06390 [Steroidobacteraceae bacterium]|nr:hypothetical protein [Steroidobacteraceae bacterium]